MIDIIESAFIKNLNDINQIFKGVYNSRDKHENVWTCNNGRLSMYEQKQFPSYIEIEIDSSSLVSKKGTKTAQGKKLDNFLSIIGESKFTMNSIEFFKYLQTSKSDFSPLPKTYYETDIEGNPLVNDNGEPIMLTREDITPIGTIYNDNDSLLFKDKYETFECNYDNSHREINNIEENLLGVCNLSTLLIKDCGDIPFYITLDFTNDDKIIPRINVDIDNIESHLTFKYHTKFIPYMAKIDEITIEIYATDLEYVYDIVFKCEYKYITVRSMIRVLEN